jgi:hypothetical protein
VSGCPVECTIKIVDLEDAPQFTALSYVWGPPEPAHEIIVNGRLLTIRENLFNFLCEFRKMTVEDVSDEWLWIDQITIDQTTAERNHQVQIMSEIYSGAESVIVWLGMGERRVRIDKLCQYAGTEYEAAQDYIKTMNMDTFAATTQNPYFRRLWVVQEFLLAKQIRMLVKDTWLYVEDDSREHQLDYQYMRSNVQYGAYYLIYQRRLSIEGLRTHALRNLLIWFSSNECEDPRDKVYGLLGLAEPADIQRLQVDYAKSPQQVFLDLMLTVMQEYSAPTSDPARTGRVQGVTVDHLPVKTRKNERVFYQLNILVLSLRMNLTKPQRTSIYILIESIYAPDGPFRSHEGKCLITAMGHDEADAAHDTVERWWFDFKGERYFLECADSWKPESFNVKTRLLLSEVLKDSHKYSVYSKLADDYNARFK